MTESHREEEVLGMRFRITWPYWAAPYPNQQIALEIYQEHQSSLQADFAKKVSQRLGGDYHLTAISHRPFEPSGIELSCKVIGSSPPIQRLSTGVVRELGGLAESFFRVYMPQAKAGANAYYVESEFWDPRSGWLEKVESAEAPPTSKERDKRQDTKDFISSTSEIRRAESPQISTMTNREYEELLMAFATKYLRPDILTSRGPALRGNVEQVLSTHRFLRVVYERPENAELYRALGKEIEATPARPIVDSLRDLGILDALDDAPGLIFANLQRSVIPNEDFDMFRRGGIEDPEAEITILVHKARDFASTGKSASDTLTEAVEVLRRKGEQMKTDKTSASSPKKRKFFNGIGNLLMGVATAGGNALLTAGTIAAPNPATAYLAMGSAAVAVGAVFKGLGDLQGE